MSPLNRGSMKGWQFAALLLGMLVAAAGIIVPLLGGYYQSDADAAAHEVQFTKHVGEFSAHLAHATARDQVVDEMRTTLGEMSRIQRENQGNLIRLMERWRVQPVRRAEP